MSTQNPNMVDGSSQVPIHWKASNIEFVDGETLQYKFDNRIIGGSVEEQIQIYRDLGENDDGVVTQKKLTEELSNINATIRSLQDSLTALQSAKKKAAAPYQRSVLMYNGREQTANLVYDPAAVQLSGTLSARDAGSYTWVATLNEGYEWTDGDTSTTKTGTWVIEPVGSSEPVDPTPPDPTPEPEPEPETNVTLTSATKNLALNRTNTTAEITYTTNSDGELTVSVDDTSVATVKTLNSANRKATIQAQATGNSEVVAQVKASTNYTASPILRIPLSVQMENSVALLWDGPITGTGKGWVRVSGRSTSSNIMEISDANYDNTMWPFSAMTEESVTINGTSIDCVVFPVMYHRFTKISKDRILYFVESEATENNKVMIANTVWTNTGEHVYPLALSKSIRALGSKTIFDAQGGDDWTHVGAWTMDIWDWHLVLKLMAIDLNPGKSLNKMATSWRGLTGLQSTQFLNGIRSVLTGSGTNRKITVNIQSGAYGDPQGKIYKGRGLVQEVAKTTLGTSADFSLTAGESIATSWTPHYGTGCWATNSPSVYSDLSQLFIELPSATDSSSAGSNFLNYSNFDTNMASAQVSSFTLTNTATDSTVRNKISATTGYASLGLSYDVISFIYLNSSSTVSARLHGWKGFS